MKIMPNQNNRQIKIFCLKDSKDFRDYELLDTGDGEKLERFGLYIFVRPYEDAVWKKTLPESEWNKADGKFWSSKQGAKAGWKMKNEQGESLLKKWEMEYKGIKFLARPTSFRHLGFFPEHAVHWDFIEERIKSAEVGLPQKVKFLNLFGYTGVASLFALRAGAEVTHLDASKQVLNWAKENQKLSDLQNLPMRVIEDDAIKFLEREAKRGNKYDVIIMDPPKFGRGPKGEVWKIEEMLPKLLSAVHQVLSDQPLFVILTSYADDSSSLTTGYALEEMMKDFGGHVEAGELCILEKSNGRVIPLANTAVWSII
ncbi:MAG: SAM-dependent methyltransferase [Parcubacteria group bacterium GW2011_GWA2_40_37]|nr:MAG: SAM-dependent methyltransferase [Parcubacteria group bacterium GW2011_GWA2_40_37]